MNDVSNSSLPRISRRRALATATLAGSAFGFPAIVGAQTKRFAKPIVAGLNGKEGDPTFESIALIPKILKEKYNVEIDMQLHPASTLGSDQSLLESVQTGFVGINSNTTSQWSPFTDAWHFQDLPYVVSDWDMALRFYKSDLFWQQAKKMEQKVNIKVLPPVGAGGFRLMWNNKRPVKVPGDVQGLKIRSTTSPIVIELNKLWGFNPTPIAWTETYTALQQGVVDGMEVQAIWTYKFNMFEVLKYAIDLRATFTTQLQVMNGDLWRAMPEDIQKAFMAAAQDAADIANVNDRKLDDQYRKLLADKGMQIYSPNEAEYKQWRELGEKVWGGAGKNVDRAVIDQLVRMQKA